MSLITVECPDSHEIGAESRAYFDVGVDGPGCPVASPQVASPVRKQLRKVVRSASRLGHGSHNTRLLKRCANYVLDKSSASPLVGATLWAPWDSNPQPTD